MKKRRWLVLLAVAAVLVGTVCFAAGCKKKDIEGLYKPTNITYDGARITWDKVALAEHYTVQINDGEAKRVNTNLFTFDAKQTEFDVTVSAVLGEKSIGETVHFIPLDTIETIDVSDSGELSWDEVAGATGYRLSLNGDVQPVDLTEARYVAQAGSNRIKVRPVVSGDNSYYSLWSAEIGLYTAGCGNICLC